MICRSCQSDLTNVVIDLGFAPPSNAYIARDGLNKPEVYFPLRVLVCNSCWLVQTEDFLGRDDVFDSDYHYFSSTSISWVQHAKTYTESVIADLSLDSKSFIVEIASNDGYLLQHFQSSGIPCLGIEPTLSTAVVSQKKGIPTLIEFYGSELAHRIAKDYRLADLVIGNNVFAHVPELNDFCEGIFVLLAKNGVCTLEFPHLLSLLKFNQFDTIYHEHFSYLSLISITPLLDRHNLRIFRVDKLSTHGGSLRVYICKKDANWPSNGSLEILTEEERNFGLDTRSGYTGLWSQARKMKIDLLKFLITCRDEGRTVVGYGAAAKGNTFLNYAGIDSDLIQYVVDASNSKQSKFLPGSHIPIYSPEMLSKVRPNVLLVLPWNIADEVLLQNRELLDSGCDFFVAVPELRKLN
jgi:hypothetical protein